MRPSICATGEHITREHVTTIHSAYSEDRTTKPGVRGKMVKQVSPALTKFHAFANNGETTHVTKSNADYPFGQNEYRKEHDAGFIKQGNLQHIDVPSIYVCCYINIDNFIMCISEIERINKEMPHTVEGTTEDSEHTATSLSGDQESSGNYSPKKLSYDALGGGLKSQQTLFRELLDMKGRVFEEDCRRTLESKYLLHFKLGCVLANAIRSYTYHMCQCFTETNLVHFKKIKSDHELPGKHSVKEYFLHVCGNSAIRRHELRHILQKCFDFDVVDSLSTHPLPFEMDESFESKMNGLWMYLDSIFPSDLRRSQFTQDELPEEEEMRYEGSRLGSFHKVNMNVSYLRLAAAGFYATKNGDETRCFSCGITHRYWEPRDNPFVVHNQRSPNCKHVTGTDDKNVLFQPSTGFTADNRPPEDRRGHDRTQHTNLSENVSQDRNNTDVLGATGPSRNSPTSSELEATQSLPTQQSATPTREANEIAPVLSFDGSVHPHYSSSETRLASFNVWPEDHSQRPEELVRAGFFYAGYADCVRCFVCGVGLRTWEDGDDPWTEHVRWRPSCAYVEAVRGERFIIQTLAAIGRSKQATPQTDLNQQTSNNKINQGKVGEEILTDVACKRALEMGFNREKVKAAAQETVYAAGKSSLTLEVLLETILVTDGEESEQTEAAQPMASEVPTGAEANIGSGSDDIIQGAPRGTDTPLTLNSAGGKRRSSDPQAETRQILHRATEDKDSSSDHKSIETAGLTTSSLATHKAEEGENPRTLNRPRQFILTGQRTSDRTNIFYNTDNDSPKPLPEAAPSVDTMSSLADSEGGRNGGGSATVNSFLSMPTERQRPENIDKIKNKFQHKGKSKEELKATEEETRQLRESSTCKVCLEDPANIVFLPCGHLVACAVCTPALERCPVCRRHIRGTVRVHLAEMTSREKHINYL